MNEIDQAEHFACELDALLRRTVEEYELSYYAIVGVLTLATAKLAHEAFSREDDADDDQPPTDDDFKNQP